jgi:hypothetical protein
VYRRFISVTSLTDLNASNAGKGGDTYRPHLMVISRGSKLDHERPNWGRYSEIGEGIPRFPAMPLELRVRLSCACE